MINAKRQGRSKTRPGEGCAVVVGCGVEGTLERSGRGPSTPTSLRFCLDVEMQEVPINLRGFP